MAISKKDFIALADTMKAFFETNAGREMDVHTRGVLLNHLVWFQQDQNSNFMRDRWLDYISGNCGKNGGTVKAKKCSLCAGQLQPHEYTSGRHAWDCGKNGGKVAE